MNNDDNNQNSGSITPKPSYLSSESPDTLANPEIKTTSVGQTPVSSLNGNTFTNSVGNIEVEPAPYPGQPINQPQNYSQPQYLQPTAPAYPMQQPQYLKPEPVAPITTIKEREVIYKNSEGNIITNILGQLVNCFGRLLFIVSAAIIAIVFWINF